MFEADCSGAEADSPASGGVAVAAAKSGGAPALGDPLPPDSAMCRGSSFAFNAGMIDNSVTKKLQVVINKFK